ncbi:pre-mRNA-processing factor 39 isoform X1 [Iris pallida]|uniref:Pre-mRNA-processing factor 39 isoform X1 n=1 Tax=Iris pallida TaxID=29817 RepID=A0AAX6H6A6_IRIPA|nr:pre-mRNA-processing factor 39 isoform X1 [Iris pallida]
MFPGAIIQFSFVELEQATEKFSRSNLIGIGESSNVHRGQANDGIIVAIKKLNLPGGFEEDYGFLDEFLDMFWDVRAIKKAHHRHAKLFLHQKSALVSKKEKQMIPLLLTRQKCRGPTQASLHLVNLLWEHIVMLKISGQLVMDKMFRLGLRHLGNSGNPSYAPQAVYNAYGYANYGQPQMPTASPQATVYATYPPSHSMQVVKD